jgi:CubicO group peptidase (beta-lactamase class C family)
LPSRNRITVRGHEDEDVTGIHGEVAPGFEAVRDAFARLFADGAERGAAAAAVVDGRRVADLWGGTVRRDALVHVYSVSKPFAAACALWLVDRGMLELDTRVVELWPEYGQGGSIGWADPARGLAWAYATTRIGDHERALSCEAALLAAIDGAPRH